MELSLNANVWIGLVVGLVLIGIFFIFLNTRESGGRAKGRPTFLIVGPSGAGKTSLFLKWTGSSHTRTVTSQIPNKTNELRLPFGQQAIDTNYTLIDLPGHPKLEYLTTAEIKGNRNNLLGIIYLVDAASGPDTVAMAAKGLLSILTLTEKRAGGVDILVAANKSDVFNVLSSSRLQKMLEDQIQQLRETSAKGLGDVDADEDELDRSWVGGDQKFEFDHLEGKVTVLSGSVLGDATTKWEGWVEETALNH